MPRVSKKIQVETQDNQNLEPANPVSGDIAPVVETVVPSGPRPTLQGEAFAGGDVPTQEVAGFLEITPEGHGFLRPKFIASQDDVYISASQIRKFQLRPGDFVSGLGRAPKENERYFGILKIVEINGVAAEKLGKRVRFEELTAIYPDQQISLTSGKLPYQLE